MTPFPIARAPAAPLRGIVWLGLICVWLLAVPAWAQEAASSGSSALSYGAKAGGSISNLYYQEHAAADNRSGFVVGGFARYRFLPWLSAGADLLYNMAGTTNYRSSVAALQANILNNPNTVTQRNTRFDYIQSDIQLHQVELPLMAIFDLGGADADVIRPYAALGGYAAYAFGAMSHDRYQVVYVNTSAGALNQVPFNTTLTNNVTGRIEKFDYGVVVGGGSAFTIGSNDWLLDVRYRLGLANLNNEFDTRNLTSGVLQVTVGYTISRNN